YLNGFSTSLPASMQQDLVRMVPGLEEARIIRPGYAIEYDFVDPRELGRDLQSRRVGGLFHAGQVNGTTGYEEAACQGLLAGINAAALVSGRPSFRLSRNEAYMGVLVDDLIKQGVDEPYRIFTSRAEYRLSLRYDNADERLRRYGRNLGLVDDTDWGRFNVRRDGIASAKRLLNTTRLRRSDASYLAVSEIAGTDLGASTSLANLATRRGVTPELIWNLLSEAVGITDLESALADNLYDGYIKAQELAIKRLHRNDDTGIP